MAKTFVNDKNQDGNVSFVLVNLSDKLYNTQAGYIMIWIALSDLEYNAAV